MISAKQTRVGEMIKLLIALVLATVSVIAVPAVRTLASKSVPFHARLIQTITVGPCPPGTPASAVCFSQTGTGTATHFGKVTKASLTVNTFISPSCATFVEYTTFTAADGSTMTLVQTGTGCFTSPTTASANATYTVTGGTGRFSGATGSGTATTTVSAVAPGVLVGPATYTGFLLLHGTPD